MVVRIITVLSFQLSSSRQDIFAMRFVVLSHQMYHSIFYHVNAKVLFFLASLHALLSSYVSIMIQIYCSVGIVDNDYQTQHCTRRNGEMKW